MACGCGEMFTVAFDGFIDSCNTCHFSRIDYKSDYVRNRIERICPIDASQNRTVAFATDLIFFVYQESSKTFATSIDIE